MAAWGVVVAVCLAAPWVTRALLIGEKGLAPRLADFRGVLADGSVALGAAGLVGALLLTRRWWGKALGWLVLVAFLLATFAIYEFVSMFDSLYALTPGWPKGDVLTVRNVRASADTQISLLGCEKEIAWKKVGDNIEIELHNIGISDLPCEHIFTFKISECQPAK